MTVDFRRDHAARAVERSGRAMDGRTEAPIMYETPLLERYGSFRELTMKGNTAKRSGVNDLASVLNTQQSNSPNDGCNPQAMPWSHAGCFS